MIPVIMLMVLALVLTANRSAPSRARACPNSEITLGEQILCDLGTDGVASFRVGRATTASRKRSLATALRT
jgi:hypothetical protein